MKSKNGILILAVAIILALSLVACSKSQATTAPEENQVATQQKPVTTTQETSDSTSEPTGVPEDVPVMPDAYELQVPNQLNLTYKVNLPIKDVVAWYDQELPNYGWDQASIPDTAQGSMAQMSRSNTNGDRIAFSLQYNPIGEFTIVQIYITRAK